MNKDDLKETFTAEEIVDENVEKGQQVEDSDQSKEEATVEVQDKGIVDSPTEEVPVEESPVDESTSEEIQEPVVEVVEEEVQQPSEAAIYLERLTRLHADFENYRKRVARDKADMIKSANAELLEAILPSLDLIDHALASLEKTAATPGDETSTGEAAPNPYVEGFKLIQSELLRGLGKFGLKPIESIGKPFDVEYHEALSKMPSDSVAPEHVLFEVRKGYTLNDKVLRATQVIVSAPIE